ncbi:MAG TPA: terminase small subunit [Limnochordia bacterium]|nr:terminase small subunit [Limnochordia bacterium]
MALKEKQKAFVEDFLIHGNAKLAAINSGYSPRSAESQGCRMLKMPAVLKYLEMRRAEIARRTGVTPERVMQELARIAFLDPTDLADMDTATVKASATKDDRAAIASIKVKTIPTEQGDGVEREIRFADKIKALELIGKKYGMWTDTHKIDLNAKVEIVDDVPSDAQPAEDDVPEGD